MQTPSQKILSFTFPNPYPRVLQPPWQRYREVAAKENIFSHDLLFVVVGLEVFFCFWFWFFIFDGEWSLRLSFDVFCIRPHSHCLSLLPSLSPSLFLCLCMSLRFLFASFPLLVSGSRPPLSCCKTQDVWSVRRVLVVPPSLPARPS